MTLRIAVLGCLLAAVGWADEPITMHNDPMTGYNGSIRFKLMQRTTIPQLSNSKLALTPGSNYLATHGHPGTHTVLVLKPLVPGGALTKAKEIPVNDGDVMHIYFLGQPTSGNGQIVIGRQQVPGAHKFIQAHASLDDKFLVLERTLQDQVKRGPRSDPKVLAAAARLADLPSAHARATAVADTVWVIQATQGSFQTTDKNGTQTTWPSPLSDKPLPPIYPAPNDDPYSVWATYSDVNAKMAALKVLHGDQVTAEFSTLDECTAIHFCHMNDVRDKNGNWTLQPNCGPVRFTCHGKTYNWTPPSTGVSKQTGSSAK